VRPLVRPLREYDPFLLGVVASVLIVATVLGTLAFGLLGLDKKAYAAEFAQAGELARGNEVRVAGLRVGEVVGVGLEGDHVLVRFRIDRGVHLGSGTRASIKLATLLGTRYLELSPSGPGSLPDDRIPLAHSTVPYNLQDVLQDGTPLFQQIDAAGLRNSLAATANALRGRGPQLGAAFDGMARVSDVVLARKEQFAQLIQNLDSVTKLVDNRSDQIFALVTQSNTLVSQLLRRREAIRSLLGDAASLTDELNQLLRTNEPEVAPLLHNAEQLTGLLREQNDAVDRALTVIGTTSRYLTNVAGNGPYIDIYLPNSIVPDNVLCLAQLVAGCK
jgi:phospholipid/cholesterol/gamma-HCH transport system substrate-binding protein